MSSACPLPSRRSQEPAGGGGAAGAGLGTPGHAGDAGSVFLGRPQPRPRFQAGRGATQAAAAGGARRLHQAAPPPHGEGGGLRGAEGVTGGLGGGVGLLLVPRCKPFPSRKRWFPMSTNWEPTSQFVSSSLTWSRVELCPCLFCRRLSQYLVLLTKLPSEDASLPPEEFDSLLRPLA